MFHRIPQDFIDDLLERINIIDIIKTYLSCKKKGRHYFANCPFHKEKTPSFMINADKQFYYCFGCHAKGNAINFLTKYRSIDFLDALNYLAAQVGVQVPNKDTTEQDSKYYKSTQLMQEAVVFYQSFLYKQNKTSPVWKYLDSRGLNKEICKKFSIGFAPLKWDMLKNEFPNSTSDLIDIGLLIVNENKKSSYDRFRNRIIFPIRNKKGQYVAIGARSIDNSAPKYLNSPEIIFIQKT